MGHQCLKCKFARFFQTKASLILESPLPSSIQIADAATNLQQATVTSSEPADATADTGTGGHKMPKLSFQKSEESSSLVSLNHTK